MSRALPCFKVFGELKRSRTSKYAPQELEKDVEADFRRCLICVNEYSDFTRYKISLYRIPMQLKISNYLEGSCHMF